MIRSHMSQKINPKINVSFKDVKRYYRRNQDKFVVKPGRTIHMIRAENAAAADRIDSRLADGDPFLEIAGDAELNQYKPAQQGLFGEGLQGEQILTKGLNEPMLKLEAGQNTPRIAMGDSFYWVYVKTISEGKAQTLTEVQGQIRFLLVNQRHRRLVREYHVELLRAGSLDPRGPESDPLSVMVDSLVEVAMSRYAQPE